MFAVYARHADADTPLAALKVGELPEPRAPDGWTRVKISHASFNRHDLFTLRGITAYPEGITYPMVLGNDAAGTLDDGTPVVIYPMMGSADWRGDETLDPAFLASDDSSYITGAKLFADGGFARKCRQQPAEGRETSSWMSGIKRAMLA